MTLVPMKCPGCGGEIQLDDSKEFGFCMFCGAKIQNDAASVRNIRMDRSSEIVGLLNLAYISMSERDYAKANSLSDEVLRMDGFASDAWYIKARCTSNESTRGFCESRAGSEGSRSYGVLSREGYIKALGKTIRLRLTSAKLMSGGTSVFVYHDGERAGKGHKVGEVVEFRLTEGPHTIRIDYISGGSCYASGTVNLNVSSEMFLETKWDFLKRLSLIHVSGR